MTIVDMPPHLPMTAEEFEQLPEVEGWRMELWEGNLDVAAAAQMAWHSSTIRRIANMIEAQGRTVHAETGVVLGPRTVRAPDISRFRSGIRPDINRSQFAAADVDLVVEIISPESERRDREVKPEEYAGAGIPEFWLVERHPDDADDAMVNTYRLTPGSVYLLTRRVALSELTGELEQQIER